MTLKRQDIVLNILGLIILAFIVTGCPKNIEPDAQWLREEFELVKVVCMGVMEDIPPESMPTVKIVGGSYVECGDNLKAKGCYSGSENQITIISKARRGVLRHEYIHAILKQTTGSSDPNHESEFFEKCSGVIIENDVIE